MSETKHDHSMPPMASEHDGADYAALTEKLKRRREELRVLKNGRQVRELGDTERKEARRLQQEIDQIKEIREEIPADERRTGTLPSPLAKHTAIEQQLDEEEERARTLTLPTGKKTRPSEASATTNQTDQPTKPVERYDIKQILAAQAGQYDFKKLTAGQTPKKRISAEDQAADAQHLKMMQEYIEKFSAANAQQNQHNAAPAVITHRPGATPRPADVLQQPEDALASLLKSWGLRPQMKPAEAHIFLINKAKNDFGVTLGTDGSPQGFWSKRKAKTLEQDDDDFSRLQKTIKLLNEKMSNTTMALDLNRDEEEAPHTPLRNVRKNKWFQALGLLGASLLYGNASHNVEIKEKTTTVAHTETMKVPAPEQLPTDRHIRATIDNHTNELTFTPEEAAQLDKLHDSHDQALQPAPENPIFSTSFQIAVGDNPWSTINKGLRQLSDFHSLPGYSKDNVISDLDNFYLQHKAEFSSDKGRFLPGSTFYFGKLLKSFGLEKIQDMIQKLNPQNKTADKPLIEQLRQTHQKSLDQYKQDHGQPKPKLNTNHQPTQHASYGSPFATQKTPAISNVQSREEDLITIPKGYNPDTKINLGELMDRSELAGKKIAAVEQKLLPKLAQLQKTHSLKFVKDPIGRYALDAGWFGAGERRWKKYVEKNDAEILEVAKLILEHNNLKTGQTA